MQSTAIPDSSVRSIITRYAAAENAKDIEALMALIHDEIVFEDTAPPAGNRHSGIDAFRAFVEDVFASAPNLSVDLEDMIVSGNRAAATYRYTWSETPQGDDPGFVRGIAFFTIRDGKVIEMFPYVKG